MFFGTVFSVRSVKPALVALQYNVTAGMKIFIRYLYAF